MDEQVKEAIMCWYLERGTRGFVCKRLHEIPDYSLLAPRYIKDVDHGNAAKPFDFRLTPKALELIGVK